MAAAFNSSGEVLLLKRSTDQHCGGLWSFPGGKVEPGESPQAAAMRELQEETGLTGSTWQSLGTHSFTYPDRLLHFQLFGCLCASLTSLGCESEHAWVARDRLVDYPMPAANSALLGMLGAYRVSVKDGNQDEDQDRE
nr:(deoxy)nucleoside triphosphate pyrophosphohydrolase [Mariprofundus ferrooxydans]